MFNKILTCLALLLTAISLGAYWFFAGQLGISANGSDWANFGSYVGGIFSGLAFLILIYQNYQREIEQKQQSENQRKQDFERTFFMMLEHHNNKLRFLEDKDNGLDKLSLVDFIYEKIVNNNHSFVSAKEEINSVHYKEYSEINAYFLNLFRILKFIYKNKEFNFNKEYSSLLRSFLSKKILTILSFHLCGKDRTYDEYIYYVNEFNFLEHMDIQYFESDFLMECFKYNQFFKNDFKVKNIRYFNSEMNNKIYYKIKEIFWYSRCDDNGFKDYKEREGASRVFEFFRIKRKNCPLPKDFWRKDYKILEYHQIHFFLYLILTFDKAFQGNLEYRYIKNIYQEFVTELKNSRLIEK